ncbi:hypothetical protein GO491_11970 [Flavobacteriaceae bacterium Ap0902]|nr:hypothetical protein [Flavobacteriaceae bacterium Ap0902]
MKILNKPLLIAVVLALIAGALSIYLFKQNRILKAEKKHLNEVIASTPQRTTEQFIDSVIVPIYREKDTLITKYKIVKRMQHNNIRESSIPTTYLDSVARALEVGKKAITKINRIETKANIELKKKDLVIQEKEQKIEKLEKEIWHWKNENSEVFANLTDSTARVKYNAKITVTDFSKRPNWYSGRQHYTAISTDDPNLKINGFQTFEQKINVQCSKLGIGAYVGYGAQLNNGLVQVGPQIGVGIRYDLF